MKILLLILLISTIAVMTFALINSTGISSVILLCVNAALILSTIDVILHIYHGHP